MATPTAAELNESLRGFDRLYGLELVEWSDSEVRAQVAVREELTQGSGWCTAACMRRWPSR